MATRYRCPALQARGKSACRGAAANLHHPCGTCNNRRRQSSAAPHKYPGLRLETHAGDPGAFLLGKNTALHPVRGPCPAAASASSPGLPARLQHILRLRRNTPPDCRADNPLQHRRGAAGKRLQHNVSNRLRGRRYRAFISINCAALQSSEMNNKPVLAFIHATSETLLKRFSERGRVRGRTHPFRVPIKAESIH